MLIEAGLLLVAIALAIVLPRDQLRRSRLWTVVAWAPFVFLMGLTGYSWVTQVLSGLIGASDFYPEILYSAGLFVVGSGAIVVIRWVRIPELRARGKRVDDSGGRRHA